MYAGIMESTAVRTDDDEIKELRVKIGVRYHKKLHMLRVLRGKKMANAIEEALDEYFARLVAEDESGADEPARAEA